MSLSAEEIKRLAHLARIAVTDTEIAAVIPPLNSVFALIEEMQAVDTSSIEPMSHPQDLTLRLRDDVVTESNHREAFQKIAPQVEAGLYLVPKVIE